MGSIEFTDSSVYYFYLTLFAVGLVPWAFFDFSKTKYMQYTTMSLRLTAFFAMVIMGLAYIGSGRGAQAANVPLFDLTAIPQLFGVVVYR